MNCCVILYGSSGEGKTTAAMKIAEKAKKSGFIVKGILSRRVYVNDSHVGFDLLNLETGEHTIFARLKTMVSGSDWLTFESLIYGFSKNGLNIANMILVNSIRNVGAKTLIFIDEYGRLESRDLGIFSGFMSVVGCDSSVGSVLIICRNDKVDEVVQIVKERFSKLFVCGVSDYESITCFS